MTDIHIQGLRALAESLNQSPTRLGLDTLPLNPPQFVGGRYREFFYRKDIEEVCAALEARDARIAALEEELASHKQSMTAIDEACEEIEKAKEWLEDDDDLSEADDALDRALDLLA
jgi:hypothetical protein